MKDQSTCSIYNNAFWLLGATTRDARLSIIEKSEERSLHEDPDKCQKAKSDLTNPRARIAAEVSWLPGVSPRMAEKLVSDLASNPLEIASLTGLPELARANLMSSALELARSDSLTSKTMARFMREFGEVADDIDTDAVLRDINEDRSVAGFPEVRDLGVLEDELVDSQVD